MLSAVCSDHQSSHCCHCGHCGQLPSGRITFNERDPLDSFTSIENSTAHDGRSIPVKVKISGIGRIY